MLWQVIHPRTDNPNRSRHQLCRATASNPMALHVIHLTVVTPVKPSEQMRLVSREVCIRHPQFLKTKLLPPTLDVLGQVLQIKSGFVFHRYNASMVHIADRLYTAEQVRRLDRLAIDAHGIAGYTLMNRAAVAVFETARGRFTSARHWLVLCGAGNNGGDGFAIARLARKAGLKVTVCALVDPRTLRGDAKRAAADWIKADGVIRQWPLRGRVGAELVVDALLGTGLERPVDGAFSRAVAWMNAQDCPVVSVDVPSGLNADTGQVMGCAVRAKLTVSFIGQKRGLYTAAGPDHAGELHFHDLATPNAIHHAISEYGIKIRELSISEFLGQRPRDSHKGSYGHTLVVGGAPGMSGAATLAGTAALRTGSGLVSVATHKVHAHTLNHSRPELMVAAVKKAATLSPLLQRANVVALGPGLGQGAWSEKVWEACIETQHPLVVDADGLNLLARSPRKRKQWVLTPHPAEAARLLQCKTEDVQEDRVRQAQRLARAYHAVVVLKGCGTVVVDQAGQYGICVLGNPGMATAGAGDVLTGVLSGLMAQGLSPWQAAVSGVAAHAAAGDRVASEQGERGLLAGDLCRALPRVLNP